VWSSPPIQIKLAQPHLDVEEPRRVSSVATQFPGTGIGVCSLRSRMAPHDCERPAKRRLEIQLVLSTARRVWQPLEYVEPLREMGDSFCMG